MATIDSTKKIVEADGGEKAFHLQRVDAGKIWIFSSPTGNPDDWAGIGTIPKHETTKNMELNVIRPSDWKIRIVSESEIMSVEEAEL